MKHSSLSYLSLVVSLLCFAAFSCEGRKNRDLPHIHRGVLSSYEAGPFSSIDLDSKDEKVLNDGKPIMKQTQGEGEDELGGSSICVQDVAAPKVGLLLLVVVGLVASVWLCVNILLAGRHFCLLLL